jgi:hypothetical protein
VVWVITHAFAAAFPFVASGYLQDTLSGYDWEQKLDPPMFREGVYVAAGVAVCSLLAALTSLLWARRLRAAAREGPLNGAGVASASISPEYVDLDLGGGEAVVSRRPCKLARHCVSRSARLVCSIEINS